MASNFCRNCGCRLTEGKPFCGNCGTKVISIESAPAPAAEPAAAAVAEPAPAAAPAAEPAAQPVAAAEPAEKAEPEVQTEAPAMPQPLQTVVTYHPEEPVQVDLPEGALNQVPEVIDASEAQAIPSVPVTAELVPAAPAVPATPAAPVAPAPSPVPDYTVHPAAPQKKSNAGLIVGLVCGGVVFISLLGIGLFFMFAGDFSGFNNTVPNGNGTILDRIEVMEEVSSGKNYTVYNQAFNKKIEEARWWDYDGTLKSQGVYYKDTKNMAFSIRVDENTKEKVYYAFYYSKDDDFDKTELGSPKYSAEIAPSYYKDGNAYYNIECKKSLKPGYYCVIVSKDKNFKTPYVVAYAKVLNERSKNG